MLKQIILISLLFTACSRQANQDKELIVFNEKKITQSKFIKSILQQGFLLFGKELVSNLKDKDVFKTIKQKTLEVELENIFIQNIADERNIIIKNAELKEWIENRTNGLPKIELEYFLNYSNMSLKEWKALFKNQLLKEKIIRLYLTDGESLNKTRDQNSDVVAKNNANLSTTSQPSQNSSLNKVSIQNSNEKEQQYQVAILSFDSTVEAQNIYKELKAFPKRIDQMLLSRKATKAPDWITKNDEALFEKASALSVGGLSKPFETTWGHVIIKLLKSSKRPIIVPAKLMSKTTEKPAIYLKKLSDFRENKALKIDLKSIYGLELK